MSRVRAPYDPGGESVGTLKRYIDLSYDPQRLSDSLRTVPPKLPYLSLVIHPLQASGREVPDGGLVIGGHDALRKNLRTVLEMVERIGRSPQFMTIAAFRKMWLGEKGDFEEGEFPVEKQKRESRDERKKGATKRAGMEGDKAVRRMESPRHGVKEGSRRRRPDPRRQRG
jgi:hypothetical protein